MQALMNLEIWVVTWLQGFIIPILPIVRHINFIFGVLLNMLDLHAWNLDICIVYGNVKLNKNKKKLLTGVNGEIDDPLA